MVVKEEEARKEAEAKQDKEMVKVKKGAEQEASKTMAHTLRQLRKDDRLMIEKIMEDC